MLGNLGSALRGSLGQYCNKAIEFYTKSLNIPRELGDRVGEGHNLRATGNLEVARNAENACGAGLTPPDEDPENILTPFLVSTSDCQAIEFKGPSRI